MPVKPEDYNAGQAAMVRDGFPPELLLTAEERLAGWARLPPPSKWSGNNQRSEIVNRGETNLIARKTNSKTKPIVTGTIIPGSGNDDGKGYSHMDMGQLVATHNELATRAGTPHETDFPSLVAGIHACQALDRKLAVPQTPAGEKETDVAKKAKKTAKTKKVATPKVEAPDNRSAVCKEFGARDGTNRQKLIDCVFGAGAKGAKRNVVLKAVYGSANEKNAGAMDMVWKGVPDMIAKERLGSKYEASRTGKGEETVYAIKKK